MSEQTCEVLSGCQKPAVLRYPAMGGGYMHLCAAHGEKHASYCERLTPDGWQPEICRNCGCHTWCPLRLRAESRQESFHALAV